MDAPRRILVVDDEIAIAETISEYLADRGFEAAAAGGADEALEAARRAPPDVVVTDIRMPGRDGFDLVAALRAAGLDPGVVFVTAYADAGMCLRAWEIEADGFIRKPLSLETLERRVRAALARRAGEAG